MGNQIRLQFTSSIENICDINDSFASAIMRVCYTGGNRNGSFISRPSIEDAVQTMFNCPIVCNYDVESDTIGGHDMDIVSTDDGVRLINLTAAIGVIPSGARYYFENIKEEDGTEHEYFVVEAILWKRSPAYDKIKRDGIESQSMEITVTNGYMQGDLYVIEKFVFTAFCLLGDGVEPCFESASLQLFDRGDCRQQFALMMQELKQKITSVNPSVQDDTNIHYIAKGGEENLDEKKKLAVQYGYDIENLDFNLEEMTLDEMRAKFEEMKTSQAEGKRRDGGEHFSLSGEQLREELVTALCSEKITTEWGEMNRYMYCDYDSDAKEVFCYDTSDWKLYGFPFSMNGDNVVIDFACKKRKKCSYVDFDEGSAEFSHKEMFEAVASASAALADSKAQERFNTEKSDLEEKYKAATEAATNTITHMNMELTELRQFKQDKLRDERSAAEDAVFAMFPDLVGVEAFEKLRENCSEMSIEDIEDKCFAIRGRNVSTQTFSAQKPKTAARVPVDKSAPSNIDNEPYGGLFKEFPPQR